MDLRRFGALFADLSRAGEADAPKIGIRLCVACVELLHVRDAGILLVDGDGGVNCFATSGPSPVGVMEDLQFTLGEGPGLDAHASGLPVFESNLARPSFVQWSAFAPAALRSGMRGVFSFPLRTGHVRLGALDLSRATPGGLSRQQRLDGEVMAGVVARRLLTAQVGAPMGLLGTDLDDPRSMRAEVHQASGMISEQLDIRAVEALVLLRAAAYASERPIDEVAHEVVLRDLRFDDHDE